MKSGPRLLSNSVWNAAAFFAGVGLNVLILPFVIGRLGVAPFGAAGLVVACIAPALIFSNSLALMLTRELALRLEPENRDHARELFATGLFLGIAVGIVIGVVLAVAGPPMAGRVFNLSGELADDLRVGFCLGALGWIFQCVAGVFLALFTARQDYARLSAVSISGTLVATLSMLILIPVFPSPSTYVGCLAAGFVTNFAVSAVLARLTLADWLALPVFHWEPFAQLFTTGKWQLGAQGGGLVAGQADRYLIGGFLQPQYVGYYVIAQRLEEAVYIGILKIGEILFPFFSSLQGDNARVGDLFFRATWILNVLAVSVLGALIPIAGNILYLWTGAEVAAEGQRVLTVLALTGIVGSSTNVFAFYLLANGRTAATALIAAVTAITTLSVSALTLAQWGWSAAGYGSLSGAAAQIIIMIVLVRRTFDFSDVWSRIWHFVLMPIGVGTIYAALLQLAAARYGLDRATAWWEVAGLYVFSAATIFLVVASSCSFGPYAGKRRGDLRTIALRVLSPRGV